MEFCDNKSIGRAIELCAEQIIMLMIMAITGLINVITSIERKLHSYCSALEYRGWNKGKGWLMEEGGIPVEHCTRE